jgi:CheY-like chemotaxis protein
MSLAAHSPERCLVADERLLNILIVDDDPDARELLLLAFRRIGVSSNVRCVNSGNEAVAYLRGDGRFSDRKQFPYPSLLITDLKMPEGDGFTLLEQLRSTPRYRIVPTIVMSASSDADDVRKSYMLGASSYFVKPARFEALERLLKLLYDLWLLAELPAVDVTGKQLDTSSAGKLGERFPQDLEPAEDVSHADEHHEPMSSDASSLATSSRKLPLGREHRRDR